MFAPIRPSPTMPMRIDTPAVEAGNTTRRTCQSAVGFVRRPASSFGLGRGTIPERWTGRAEPGFSYAGLGVPPKSAVFGGCSSARHSLDLRTQLRQLLFDCLIPPIDVVNALDVG